MRRINHKTVKRSLVHALVLLGVNGGIDAVRGQDFSSLSQAGSDGARLSVGTLNTMGWPWMPFLGSQLQMLSATNFDVLVLQEVWTKAAQDQIVGALRNKYPYSYAGSARPNEPTIGCDFSEPTGYLVSLANAYINCTISAGLNTQTLIQPYPYPSPMECNIYAIQLTLFSAPDPQSQQCHASLINAMQHLPSDGVSPFQAIGISGANQAPRFTMDGVNGQLILSKYPIRDVSETRFNSWLYNRLNIYATILNAKFAFVHFGYDVIADYGLPYPTYGTTQVDHVNDILAHSPDVVVGDFNSGPDYQPTGYNALISSAYRDLVQPQPLPTWCPPSHLSWQPCVNSGSFSTSIDHILVKQGAPGEFTGTFADGLFSDHIGVSGKVVGSPFVGIPGQSDCQEKSVSALSQQYGGMPNSAAALGFSSVQALQNAIKAFCK